VFYEKKEFYSDPDELEKRPHGGVSLALGRKVVRLDPSAHMVMLDDGTELKYDKCLIATGFNFISKYQTKYYALLFIGGKPKTLEQINNASEDAKKRVLLFRGVCF